MSIEVKEPKQRDGVDVTHPTMVNYARNMAKDGKSREEIAKVTGLPVEVAEKYEREARQQKK